jgi:dTDP-4-amino-4,6-dideoxygalactose transaminase
MLFVSEPCLGDEEKAALAEVVQGGWITMGNGVRAFERAFADLHRVDDAVAVASCTAGLHLALTALGIGAGDEVLVPSLTFVATANSVIYCGATPVFVDIEALERPLMSCKDAAKKCTPRTKAVIVMHYGGNLVDAETWREFAASRGLALVEDSAHAVGRGCTGLFGDVSVFSFFGNKNMTTAEGGMVVARDAQVLAGIRQMRSHGMTAGTLDRLIGRALSYDVTLLGYNYRMDDLRAAIGLTQLKHLANWNERRASLSRAYRSTLAKTCPELLIPFVDIERSSHHIFPVVLPKATDRQRLMEGMRTAGIQTTVHYPPVHLLTWYRDRFPTASLPQVEEFGRRELTLPLHPKMQETQVMTVASKMANFLAEAA